MQPRKLIEAIKEKDLGEIYARQPFAQACNTYKMLFDEIPSQPFEFIDNLITDFKNEKTRKVQEDTEIISRFKKGDKLLLHFGVQKTKFFEGKLLGMYRFDERCTSVYSFDLYATVQTKHYLFLMQKFDGEYYLHIFAKLKVAESIVRDLRSHLSKNKVEFVKAVLAEDKIKELKNNLGLKTIEEIIKNAKPGLNLRASGPAVENGDTEFIEFTKEGDRESFLFKTPLTTDKKDSNLFRINTGGTTYFVNNIKPRFHLKFINNHLMPLFSYESNLGITDKQAEQLIRATSKEKTKIALR